MKNISFNSILFTTDNLINSQNFSLFVKNILHLNLSDKQPAGRTGLSFEQTSNVKLDKWSKIASQSFQYNMLRRDKRSTQTKMNTVFRHIILRTGFVI